MKFLKLFISLLLYSYTISKNFVLDIKNNTTLLNNINLNYYTKILNYEESQPSIISLGSFNKFIDITFKENKLQIKKHDIIITNNSNLNIEKEKCLQNFNNEMCNFHIKTVINYLDKSLICMVSKYNTVACFYYNFSTKNISNLSVIKVNAIDIDNYNFIYSKNQRQLFLIIDGKDIFEISYLNNSIKFSSIRNNCRWFLEYIKL